jgi:hypothetical protein
MDFLRIAANSHRTHLEKSKYADIVALTSRDPLEDIAELQRFKIVIRREKVIKNELTQQNGGAQESEPRQRRKKYEVWDEI